MDLGVEIVGSRQDESLDGPRLDRRSEFLRPVMRHDQVLDLRSEEVWKTADSRRLGPYENDAKHDVADQVAVTRVPRDDVIVQFLQLADVVQDRPGNHQIAIGVVGRGK